jgi:tripartite-type tricarboxylate transporter receptor subunit TctC
VGNAYRTIFLCAVQTTVDFGLVSRTPLIEITTIGAGGAAELFGRSLASGLSAELGQQVVVETRGAPPD